MRSSFDSTTFVQARNDSAPSSSHVQATLIGCPSRSKYKKNVSPHDSELPRTACDIRSPSHICPRRYSYGAETLAHVKGTDRCRSRLAYTAERHSVSQRTSGRKADNTTIPRFVRNFCETGHTAKVRCAGGLIVRSPGGTRTHTTVRRLNCGFMAIRSSAGRTFSVNGLMEEHGCDSRGRVHASCTRTDLTRTRRIGKYTEGHLRQERQELSQAPAFARLRCSIIRFNCCSKPNRLA